MCASNGLYTSFREAKVLHFAFLNEVLDCPRHIFNWHVRVHAVLVEKIDHPDPQTLDRSLGDFSNMLWPTIHAPVSIQFKTELGGDHHLITERSQGLAHEFFVRKRTISLSRIKEGHTAFHGCADQCD